MSWKMVVVVFGPWKYSAGIFWCTIIRHAATFTQRNRLQQGVSKWQVGVSKMASFFDFWKLGIFGTRLFWYPLGCLYCSTQRGIKADGASNFLSFETLTFWYPFVLVPVWVPKRIEMSTRFVSTVWIANPQPAGRGLLWGNCRGFYRKSLNIVFSSQEVRYIDFPCMSRWEGNSVQQGWEQPPGTLLRTSSGKPRRREGTSAKS